MQDWLAARAQVSPQRTAIIEGEQQITYQALDALAAHFAGRLAAAGVQPGDRLGVLLPNSTVHAALIHASARLGAVLVPLNTRLTADEIGWQLEKTAPRALIYDDAAAQTAAQLAAPGRVLLAARDLAAAGGQKQEAGYSRWATGEIRLDAPFAIIFTSGTTGRPKGAVLTFRNVFYSAMASAYRLGVLPDDRWLCVLPLYHVGGLSILIRSALYGTAVELHNGFDVDAVNHALRTHPITLISLVPTMLHRLLEAGGGPQWRDTLRLVLLGGAAAPPDLIARCTAANIPVAATYGLSEAASQVATALPDAVRRKPGSVGKPLLFTAVRVVDEAGNPVPPGTVGEIVVSGPTVMPGYYGDDAATAQVLRGGALRTGDLGYLDEDGDLWPVQRRSDLIVSGGENVYPAEVEDVLRAHPAVKAICVVGLDHPEWGQQVAAAVVLHEGAALDAETLIAFGRQHMAGYKLPRRVRFVDALPQTASGKVRRDKVGELFQ